MEFLCKMLFLANKFTNILLTYLVRIKKVTRKKGRENLGIYARFLKKVADSSQLILSLIQELSNCPKLLDNLHKETIVKGFECNA